MKRAIFPYDFAPYYPTGVQPCPMYVDVANRIYEVIKGTRLDLPDANEKKKEIAMNVAMYFEDKMSGIELWNTFIGWHLLTYGKTLPFFDDFNELDREDVNAKEVELLIWLVLSRNYDDRFINPLAIGEEMAETIMEVLTEDEDVEINESLHDFIFDNNVANDYFKLKHVLFWLRCSYLLWSPISDKRFDELYDTYKKAFTRSEADYYAKTVFLMTTEIGPMALAPHLWLADMYLHHKMLDEAAKLSNLQYVQQDIFAVTEVNADYVVLNDSEGKKRKIRNDYPDLLTTGLYVATALVKYGDYDWEINGLLIGSQKEAYDKMCAHRKQLEFSYEHAYPLYMKRTEGKRMAFFENKSQMRDWLLKVSPEVDIDEIERRLPDGSQVAFISKTSGIIIAPNVIHAIKSKDNPYYRKCDARTLQLETMEAVLNEEIVHPELLNYLLENNMLQDGDISSMLPCELGNEIFTQNIDFIARNHRRHFYHDHDY